MSLSPRRNVVTVVAIAAALTTTSQVAAYPGSDSPPHSPRETQDADVSLVPAARTTGSRLVELGHRLGADAPIFPGDPEVAIDQWSTYAEDGYKLERISIGTHTGTHMSAPCHFIEGARCLDDLPTDYFRFPAVVIDVRDRVGPNGADFQLTWEDVRAFETKHGTVPPRSMVILNTGFAAKYGTSAYFDPAPGFLGVTVTRLMRERGAIGVGSDTFGPDATKDRLYSASYAAYKNGGITLENLTNLEQLNPIGDTITAPMVRLANGSGFQTNPLAEVAAATA